MLQLFPGYVGLDIEDGVELQEIPESFRTAMQLCRLNDLGGALIVSGTEGLRLRAGLRAGLRTLRARKMMPEVRLALLGLNADARSGLQSVKALAAQESIDCEVFQDEAAALAWLRVR